MLQTRAAGVFELVPESAEGGAGKIGAREADGGEGRQRVLGESDIVEADNRHIMGYAEALHVGGAQNADGGHVIGADDSGGTSGELAQLFEASDTALEGVGRILDDPLL